MQNQEIENPSSQINEQSELSAFGVKVQETMTTPSRPGKKPRPVWVVVGNVFGLETFFREIKGRKFRGQWSFFEDPTETLLEHLNNNNRLSYAEQVENRIERKLEKAARYETYASNAEARSASSLKRVNEINSMIPMGQPILVGHHSEKRHRKDIERMDNSMRKSVEEGKKAEYFADKAENLEYAVSKFENRRFIGNRIKESEREVAKLSKWLSADNPRLIHAKEKLEYWQSRLNAIEEKMKEDGHVVPSPKTIKVGDLIDYGGWYPVVRINKKTVTVSHWLDVPKFQYKIPYSRIKKIKSKPQT